MPPALLLLAAWVAAAQPASEIVEVHKCDFGATVPEGSQTRISGHKYFRLDGTVYSTRVSAEISGADFFRPDGAGPHIYGTLQWPGTRAELRDERVTSFDWTKPSVRISATLHGPAANRRGEEWQQVIVERDRSVLHDYGQEGERMLLLSPLETHMVSELRPVGSQFWLHSALDRLVAWSGGLETLTAYNVLVTRRRARANSYPVDPAGQRRILFTYEIDVAALGRAASAIRAAFEQWEQGLAQSWRECPRGQEGGEIIVTDAPVRASAARNSQ